MINPFNYLLSTDGFTVHSQHFLPDHPELMWTLIASNAAIAFLYVLLPLELSYIYFKRRDFPFSWVFIAVAFFGVWCSATHLVMVLGFWQPVYRLQATVDVITGLVSFGTFLAFIPATKAALKLTSPELLHKQNARLSEEIATHKQVKEELEQTSKELEKVNALEAEQNAKLAEINNMMIQRELEMVEAKKELDALKA